MNEGKKEEKWGINWEGSNEHFAISSLVHCKIKKKKR